MERRASAIEEAMALFARSSRFATWAGAGALVCVAACGGKILGAESDGSREPAASTSQPPPNPSASPSASATTEPPEAGPSEMALEAACNVWCDNNARCGKHTLDCMKDCLSNGSDQCEGKAWILCAGGNPEEKWCQIPPACEPAYCAWLRCRGGGRLPDYC